MPPLLFRVAWSAALLLLAACSTTPLRPAPAAEPTPLLLISIDALRADYLGRGDTPNLDRLAREGVRAEWMYPSYPALTFPNHFTLVTGMSPDHHGVVHNTMREEGLGEFRVADLAAVGDGRWWRAEPIWVGAEKAGLPTAIWAWPGSAAEINGVRPTRWKPYDESIPAAQRADEVARWLEEPAATRPRFAALYMEMVDGAGHDFGPDAPQTHAAVREADAAVGRLVDALARKRLLDRMNLIVVSDHGMATVAAGHVVAVEDMVPMEDAAVISIGQSVGIAPRPGRTPAVERRLLGRHPHYQCWRKGELPAHWHYGGNARVPDHLPDGGRLGCIARGRHSQTRAGCRARFAWLRSRIAFDARHVHRARPRVPQGRGDSRIRQCGRLSADDAAAGHSRARQRWRCRAAAAGAEEG